MQTFAFGNLISKRSFSPFSLLLCHPHTRSGCCMVRFFFLSSCSYLLPFALSSLHLRSKHPNFFSRLNRKKNEIKKNKKTINLKLKKKKKSGDKKKGIKRKEILNDLGFLFHAFPSYWFSLLWKKQWNDIRLCRFSLSFLKKFFSFIFVFNS